MTRLPLPLPVSFLACAIVLIAADNAAHAQTSPGTATVGAASTSQIERARLPNPAVPLSAAASVLGDPTGGSDTAAQNSAPASPDDSDLGVQSLLKARAERIRPFSVFVDGGFVNTTNVALTKRDTLNDTFAVAEIGAGFEHKLSESLSFSAAVRQQYFAYQRFDELDFGSLNVGAGLSYVLPPSLLGGGLLLSGQLGFTRLTRQGLDEEFYRSGTLSLGLQKFLQLGRAQLFTLGADIVLGLSVPHLPQRQEFGLSGGYLVQLTRAFSLQAGLRAAYFNYSAIEREDFNLSATLGATYAFSPWASAGATLAGTLDRSSRAVFDYNVLNSGASLFLRLRF